MNIILLTERRGTPVTHQLNTRFQFTVLLMAFASVCVGLCYLGYWFGVDRGQAQAAQQQAPAYVYNWHGELDTQQYSPSIEQQAQADIDALTRRLGLMQGHITRLDALGQKLVDMAGLDSDEFNFDAVPALGGPDAQDNYQSLNIPELTKAISRLVEQIEDREQQLTVLEQLVMNRNLAAEVLPSGRPVTKGFISSGYGSRISSFTGKQQFHKGVDFAGKANSEIIVVAGGVVTYSGRQSGYGYVLEVSHGDGYSTRYAHNAKNLVGVGDAVKKGQVIALMGSTGRSTGPHVHFEVLKNGTQINPGKYIVKSN